MKPNKILYPFTIFYFILFSISQMLRLFKRKKMPCRVISIRNITAGGTGKTPLVIYIARFLKDAGRNVCVLSRGYKRKVSGSSPVVVNDGERLVAGRKISGDEPYLTARTLRNVPVVVCGDRKKAGYYAIDRFGADTLLLDDGFQYTGLQRDLDIVCVNALNPFGCGMLIPAGYLREPLKNLSRADIFIITRTDRVSKEKIKEIETVISKYKKDPKIFHSYFSKKVFCRETEIDLSSLKNQRIIAISGIAMPEDFEAIIADLGINLLSHIKYPDHYFFKDRDIKKFLHDAAEFQATVLTTSKDASRLPEEFPCYVLDVKSEIMEKKEFEYMLLKEGVC